jgi:uncharacterized membrane protein
MNATSDKDRQPVFNAPEMGALAHLYRGEMYRSKIWRTRLDATTNWAVVTTGIALSVTFSHSENSPLPLILVELLVTVFLVYEARRYRYFDMWRTRVRLLEICFYGPMLRGEGVRTDNGWNEVLAQDYAHLRFHISYWEAAGRRLRRNFSWIFAILALSYVAKLCIDPVPLGSVNELWSPASIGPVPGQAVLLLGVLFHTGLILLGAVTLHGQRAAGRVKKVTADEDPMLQHWQRLTRNGGEPH